MKKVAVLIENLFDEKELIYPAIRMEEEGYKVDLIGSEKNKTYISKSGLKETSSHKSSEVDPKDYEIVIIPGGFSPDYMRRCQATIDFVREMDRLNKPIATICHGGWMLISSCDLKSKNVTGYYSIKDDLINAGANYLDKEVVVDGNIITSRTPKDLPIFMKTIIDFLK